MNDEDRLELLGAITWYFEAKALSLATVLSLRAPLSAEQQRQLRYGYSQYFVSLMSAVDVVTESKDGPAFNALLCSRLVAAGLEDGAANLRYLRELRNAIVHRNEDISARADFWENFPMLHAPAVTNRSGTTQLKSPLTYVIQLVELCESKVGPAIDEHLSNHDMFGQIETPPAERIAKLVAFLQSDQTIPKSVQGQAIGLMADIDFKQADQARFDNVRKSLTPINLPDPRSRPSGKFVI
ncbi:hypothetical protein [Variovorax sp. V116]|uniref:hypothetical protein n=1 Tax=Variovorax sp. V116 TaxID=3065953 RepID=UPI0034E88D50